MFGVTGEALVGLASAPARAHRTPDGRLDPWTSGGCGVRLSTGRLLLAPASNANGGVAGKVVTPLRRIPGDRTEYFVHMRINHNEGALSVKVEHPHRRPRGEWVDAGIGLPSHVQPWVCVPAGCSGTSDSAVPVRVRLISSTAHTLSIGPALFRVRGLANMVMEWPQMKQALALAWCESEGVVDVKDLLRDDVRLGEFAGALSLSPAQEHALGLTRSR